MEFSQRLIHWQKKSGRHHLPWSLSRDPYAIWVSEIMLQQTQVATVLPYYQRFMARFPDLRQLALAPEDEVLACWSGLGYYTRARNLQRAAKMIVTTWGGIFPQDIAAVRSMPGIGRSTAAAICAFAFGQRHAILDGNVKRVLARCFGIPGDVKQRKTEISLWQKAEQLLPDHHIEIYTQALMDLGAGICTRNTPRCSECPVNTFCYAYLNDSTDAFPQRATRKPLPSKETTMLILLNHGEVLLRKRPPSGIWGGLWSFPELPSDADLIAHCAQEFGTQVEWCDTLPRFTHIFTHFKQHISPQILNVTNTQLRVNQKDDAWLTLEKAEVAPIPTPVRKLLAELTKWQRTHAS